MKTTALYLIMIASILGTAHALNRGMCVVAWPTNDIQGRPKWAASHPRSQKLYELARTKEWAQQLYGDSILYIESYKTFLIVGRTETSAVGLMGTHICPKCTELLRWILYLPRHGVST